MSFGLWSIMLLLSFLGIGALAAEHARMSSVTATGADAAGAASAFIVYRNTIVSYLEANQGATGSLSQREIIKELPNGYTAAGLPAGAGNIVVAGGGDLRTAYIYATMIPGEMAELGPAFDGDASFGSVARGQWTSSVAGISGAVPAGVPDGAIISVVQLGD